MPTRDHDVELRAAADFELIDHCSVAAAFFVLVIRDGAVDTVFVFECGLAEPAAVRRVVFRFVCNAAFAATEQRSEKRGT